MKNWKPTTLLRSYKPNVFFLLFSAGILYYFPDSLLVKILLLLTSIAVSILVETNRIKAKEEAPLDIENVFYLKKYEGNFPMAFVFIALVLAYISFYQYAISFILVIEIVMLGIAEIFEYFYKVEAPKRYLYLEKDTIKREVGGNISVDLKKLRFVELRVECLVMYERWAHHKIVFSKFEDGQQLKANLLEKLESLEIKIKDLTFISKMQNEKT